MLFDGRYAGREPDDFSRLSDIGWRVLERWTLTIARYNHDLLRNRRGLAVIPYHKTRKSQQRSNPSGSNPLTLECVDELSSLSTSDMSSTLVWIWDRSPVSSSRLEVTCEGGADPGRLIQVTQSVCPLPHPPWPEVQVLVNETVREWTRRPKEKNGMDRPSAELRIV